MAYSCEEVFLIIEDSDFEGKYNNIDIFFSTIFFSCLIGYIGI
jgi:hypothetical protein